MAKEKVPCVKTMVAASEGRLDERDATKLVRELAHAAMLRAEKDGIPYEEAAGKVLEDRKARAKFDKELARRQVLLSYRARKRAFNEVIGLSGRAGRNQLAEALIDFNTRVNYDAEFRASQLQAGFIAEMEAAGFLKEWEKGGSEFDLAYARERFNISKGGTEAVTDNKAAFQMAKTAADYEKQYRAFAKRYGVDIAESEGRVGPQSHNSEQLRRAGSAGGKKWGEENKAAAFKVWREFMGTVRIDWDRTLPLATESQREKFLSDFFDSIYSSVHGWMESQTGEIGRRHATFGTYGDRLSVKKILHLADADSNFAYNERWGNKGHNATIMSMLSRFGRTMAVLENYGPLADTSFDKLVRELEIHAKDDPGITDSQKQAKNLRKSRVKSSYEMAVGFSGPENQVSDVFRAIKNLVLTAKSGGIGFSLIADAGIIDANMILHGASGIQRLQSLVGKHILNSPEGKRIARELAFITHTRAEVGKQRFDTTTSTNRSRTASDKSVDFVFKFNGVPHLTDWSRGRSMAILAQRLGDMADKSLDKLPPVEQALFAKEYNFNAAEWDAIRSTVFEVEDGDMKWNVITPERVMELDDEAMAKVAEAAGDTVRKKDGTFIKGELDRARDRLKGKLGAFFAHEKDSMVPTPGPRERLLMSGGSNEKGWGSGFRSLFFMFKSFTITTAARNFHTYNMLKEAGLNKHSAWHVGALVAETAILGYVGWAAREALKGRTPPNPFNDDGSVNGERMTSIVKESIKRGGGIPIYGDYLLAEYDKQSRGFLSTMAGPALAELDPLFRAATTGVKAAMGQDTKGGFSGTDAVRFGEANAPFIGLLGVKTVLDYSVIWHIKEQLSPGTVKRTGSNMEQRYGQEWIVEPAR